MCKLVINAARLFINKLVLVWDSDYTKLTPREARQVAEAENSGFIDEADINWNDLSKYAQ